MPWFQPSVSSPLAACDQWHTLDPPHVDIARFGHTAKIHDNRMYVFGGFNGLMLSDMFVYEPGELKSASTWGSKLLNMFFVNMCHLCLKSVTIRVNLVFVLARGQGCYYL